MAQAQNRHKIRSVKKERMSAVSIILLSVLSIYSLSLILLLVFGLNTSFKDFNSEWLWDKNILGFPTFKYNKPFENYLFILSRFVFKGKDMSYYSLFGPVSNNYYEYKFSFGDFVLNSFIYCFVGSFAKTFVACISGYLVSKYRYKFSRFIYVVMLIVMAVPIVGSAPSFIKLTQDLAIFDSYIGMLLLNLNFTGIYFFVFAAYFEGFSDVYLEAAEVDGSNQFRTFFQVVWPIVSKLFWTVFLLNFIALWNDYQTPMLYYPNHPTLSYAVFKMYHSTEAGGASLTQKIAGCMILAIPILVLFLSTRKALLGNMSAGGVKE